MLTVSSRPWSPARLFGTNTADRLAALATAYPFVAYGIYCVVAFLTESDSLAGYWPLFSFGPALPGLPLVWLAGAFAMALGWRRWVTPARRYWLWLAWGCSVGVSGAMWFLHSEAMAALPVATSRVGLAGATFSLGPGRADARDAYIVVMVAFPAAVELVALVGFLFIGRVPATIKVIMAAMYLNLIGVVAALLFGLSMISKQPYGGGAIYVWPLLWIMPGLIWCAYVQRTVHA